MQIVAVSEFCACTKKSVTSRSELVRKYWIDASFFFVSFKTDRLTQVQTLKFVITNFCISNVIPNLMYAWMSCTVAPNWCENIASRFAVYFLD
jgi:hypothetical protein